MNSQLPNIELEFREGTSDKDRPFIEYLSAVDNLLEDRYGITSNDVDMASVAGCQDEAWTPEECVQWFAEKYELERIDIDPYGGNNA